MNVSVPGLFRCTTCGNLDLMENVYPGGVKVVDDKAEPLVCTVCHGHPWHNQFPLQKYDPQKHDVENPPPNGEPIMTLG